MTKAAKVYSTTEAKIREILELELSVEVEDEPGSKMLVDLGMDSLDKVEFIMALEEAFGISIGDDHADKIETIQQSVAYIEAIKK